MLNRLSRPFRHRLGFLVALALVLLQGAATSGQQAAPWSGIAADEARMWNGEPHWGNSGVGVGALSADARYVTFSSNSPLLPSDTNGDFVSDVYLRDRVTGELTLISVATDGTQGNAQSTDSTISADGRHVAFSSYATNLVAGDTNGFNDVFVRDTQLGTTVRVSAGPNGEQPVVALQQGTRLSADGRYVVFVAIIDGGPAGYPFAYLRDRDPDANGIFDEPGSATSTKIFEPTVGSDELFYTYEVSISRDGLWIAYTARASVNGQDIGLRMYLHDRATSTTVRVDNPAPGYGESWGYASAPDFSEAGHLVYATGAADLVEGDPDGNDSVFVYDIAAGTNSLVQLTHANAPPLFHHTMPAVSADGRYVAFVGLGDAELGGWLYNVFAVDRQLGQSYEISVRPDLTRDNETYGAVSISADGSAIAFAATMDMLANGGISRGVFVATTVALSPAADTDVPEEGGTYTVELTAPSHTSWTIEHGAIATVSPSSGVGSATIEVTIPANTSGADVINTIVVGSEGVTFRQIPAPTVASVSPASGPVAGGTPVAIYGTGFNADTSVTFGGEPAVDLVFINSELLSAVTPAHARGWVTVIATKPTVGSGQIENGFQYLDVTPPVITSTIAGTQGLNGWYISDVTVDWTVEDPESELITEPCAQYALTTDAYADYAFCIAASEGGDWYEYVEIKRDATPPVSDIGLAAEATYFQGQEVPLFYGCNDETSGIAACTPNQSGDYLDTSALGTFNFTVTAVDDAGHSTTSSVTYTVKRATALTVSPATGVYGGTATLQATLTTGGTPLAGKTIAFYVQGLDTVTAITSASGVADLNVSLAGLNAGSRQIDAEFSGDESSLPSVDDAALVIAKATPVVSWADPAGITYGTVLSAAQLNASADVEGTFAYSPAAGAVLNAGTQALSVTFTPADAASYNSATDGVSIAVAKATPVITWGDPAGITYGTTLSTTQLNASTNVAGVLAYLPDAGTVLNAGTHSLTVAFTPTDAANYNSATGGVSIVVAKATPVITWSDPAGITYGSALSSTQLNATASVAGTFAYSPASGTVLGAGTHTLSLTFTPTDAVNYTTAATTRSIGVSSKALTLQTNDASKVYGEAPPAFTVTGTGFVNGDTVASLNGTLSFSTSATATSAPGNYSVTPGGVSSPNYTITFVAGTLTVTKASTAVALTTTPNPSNHNQSVQIRAVVSAVAPGAGTPAGTVTFRDNGVLLGTAQLVNGVATLNKNFKRGTHPLTATYAGNTNFNGSAGASTHQVN